MLTFQDSYEQIQSLTGDSSTPTTAKHKLRWNIAYRQILRKFNKRSLGTAYTEANRQDYELPYNLSKITSIKVTVSEIDYPLIEIVNEDDWNTINSQGTAFTSDVQTHYYVKDNNVFLYPTPASDGNVITYNFSLKDKDLSNANYTTGKVATIPYTTTFTAVPVEDSVAGTLSAAWSLPTGTYQIVFDNNEVRTVTLTITSAAVTWTGGLLSDCTTAGITINNAVGGSLIVGASGGDAPVWAVTMVGRYFKIDADGYWYRIYSYLSATAITLEKKFGGTAISGGTSEFTISEVPLFPEEYEMCPIHYACWLYFLDKRDIGNAAIHKQEHDRIFKSIKIEEDISTNIITDNSFVDFRNLNDYPRI